MFRLDRRHGFLVVAVALQRGQVPLGEDQPLRGYFLLERRETLLERLEVRPLPSAADARRRDLMVLSAEFVTAAHWAQRRLLERQRHDRLRDLRRHVVASIRLPARLLDQGLEPALVDRLPVPIERVPGVAPDLAGRGDVAEFFGQLEQADLVFDDLGVCTRFGVPFLEHSAPVVFSHNQGTPLLQLRRSVRSNRD